jgi:hypothetical protein
MDPIGLIKGIFSKVAHFFSSDKVQKLEHDIATWMPQALTIVQTIDGALGLDANGKVQKSISAILNIAKTYGVPLSEAELQGPNALNAALLNIGSTLLARLAPNLNLSVLNAVINSAVALLHA